MFTQITDRLFVPELIAIKHSKLEQTLKNTKDNIQRMMDSNVMLKIVGK